MKAPDDDDPGGTDGRLTAALLDYQRHSGRYKVTRREPALLFASVREILQLAAGRSCDKGSGSRTRPSTQIQEAACYFTRTGLFYPGADHYSLFGLPRGVPSPELKDRYRLLMRLTHPDFAAPGLWPPDTAVRVNRAYKVLSSPVLRREYDNSLLAAPAPARSPPSPRQATKRPWRTRLLARSGLRQTSARQQRLVVGVTGIGALVLIVGAVALGNRSASSQITHTTVPDSVKSPRPVVASAAPAAPTRAPAAHNPPSLVEAQPLLTLVLREIESGRGEKLVVLMPSDARNLPTARAFALHLNALIQDAREVRITHVAYKAERTDDALLVTSNVRLALNENSPDINSLSLSLRAEFTRRNGAVVLTGLSGTAQ